MLIKVPTGCTRQLQCTMLDPFPGKRKQPETARTHHHTRNLPNSDTCPGPPSKLQPTAIADLISPFIFPFQWRV